jgi:hypothetical protein
MIMTEEKTEVLGEKRVAVPIYPPQISHAVTRKFNALI